MDMNNRKSKNNAYTIKDFSGFRKASVDLLDAAHRKNMIHAMVEADISSSRAAIKKLRKENKSYLSLLGYILYCTAKTLNKHKQLQAYRDWRNQLIILGGDPALRRFTII